MLYRATKDKLWGVAGNAVSELCAGRVTKIVYVGANKDRSALLSNWGQALKHRSENFFRQIQTRTCAIRRESNGVSKPKHGSACHEPGNALRKLCAGQETKTCLGGSGLGYCCDQGKPTLDDQ